jgi:phytoene synthase
MDATLLDALPPLHRLAMAYAPAPLKRQWLGYLALDTRLAGVVYQLREPVLAQLRLAWWRDRLGEGAARTAKGEPLLAALAKWPDGGALLLPLVDAWELVLDPENPAVAQDFAASRARASEAFAGSLGSDVALAGELTRRWSHAEMALWRGTGAEAGVEARMSAIPRPLRPLLVLERVTAMAARKGDASALTSPGALLLAMRAGLIGR